MQHHKTTLGGSCAKRKSMDCNVVMHNNIMTRGKKRGAITGLWFPTCIKLEVHYTTPFGNEVSSFVQSQFFVLNSDQEFIISQ